MVQHETVQLSINFFLTLDTREKNRIQRCPASALYRFKKTYDSTDRQIKYNILIEQGIPKKLVNLLRMCMSETFDKVRIGNNCSENFEVRPGLKQGDSLSPVLFNLRRVGIIE